MTKRSTLLVTLLLILAMFSSGMGSSWADEEHKTPSIEGSGGKQADYDPYLYGDFLNTTYQTYKILPSSLADGNPRKSNIKVSIGEKRTISLFITSDAMFGQTEEKSENFHVKFLLLNKADWNPEKIFGSGLDTDPIGNSEVGIGRQNEEVIRFENKWFKTLEKKTQNIYELSYDKIKYTKENTINKSFPLEDGSINLTGVETDVTLEINQAGAWSLSSLIKPVGGNFWVLANQKNVSVRVKKPPGFFKKSLPILVSGIMIGGSAACTYSLKKRKKWIYKICKQFKN